MEDKHVLELCNHLRGLRESQEPTILTYYEIDVFSRELRFDNDMQVLEVACVENTLKELEVQR